MTRRAYNPPIVIEVVHAASGARHTVRVMARAASVFEVDWPMWGILGFNTASGAGTGKARMWRIDVADLRTLRNDPNYTPTAPRVRRTAPKRPTKTERADAGRQLHIDDVCVSWSAVAGGRRT